MTFSDIFSQLDQRVERDQRPQIWQDLAEHLRGANRYHELFEVLKLATRDLHGLPLVPAANAEPLSDEQQQLLEAGVIDACREVGQLLLAKGKLREAWIYLRAVGDATSIRQQLATVQPDSENLDQLIELCLHESLDVERGFRLVLEHYGICNAITTFGNVMYGRPRHERQVGIRLLLDHLYRELVENVSAHIERTRGLRPSTTSLGELLEEHPWLCDDGAYHIDTTHLASVVRFARELDDRLSQQHAFDLARYGQLLDKQLQYPDEEPFTEFYPHHERYFRALLGDDTSTHLTFFRQRAEQVDPCQSTTMAAEVYIDLLDRCGQAALAIEESLRLIPATLSTTGFAPSLLELSQRAGEFSTLKQACRERDDPIVYAIAVLEESARRR